MVREGALNPPQFFGIFIAWSDKGGRRNPGLCTGPRIDAVRLSPFSCFVVVPRTPCSLATCGLDVRIGSFAKCAWLHPLFTFEIGASGPGLRLISSRSKARQCVGVQPLSTAIGF